MTSTGAPPLTLGTSTAATPSWPREEFRSDLRLTLVLVIAASLLTGTLTLLKPRTYTATASILPSSRSGINPAAAGLSAALGVTIPGGEVGASPHFFAELVRSRGILGPLANASFPTGLAGSPKKPLPIADLLGARGESPMARRADAIKRLGQRIVTSVTVKTGIVTVSVQTTSPVASAAIADSIIRRVSEYNVRGRQAQASAERRFVERRLAEAKAELSEAENQLLNFLQTNREYRLSPQLSVAYDRLQREVGFRQQAVATLVQAYEHARIEEVRDTPMLTVVAPPEPPVFPDPRRLLSKVILAALASGFLGVSIALVRRHATRITAQVGVGSLRDFVWRR